MVNRVILVGRLGRDPETRYTSGGQAVCNFSMATDETYKDKAGERQKRTEWHRISAWGKLAEICQQYLKKGALVYIEGRIRSREWTDKESVKRTSYDIMADVMRMLGSKGDGAGRPAAATDDFGQPRAARSDSHEASAAPADDMGAEPQVTDEDIPF